MNRRDECTPDFFNRLGQAHFPEYVGIEILEIADGYLKARFAVQPHHLAPNGFLHAGSVVTLADTAAGYACVAHLPRAAKGFTTLELKANFLGTVLGGAIYCEARAVHLGKSTQVWDAEVRAEDDQRLLSSFRCTQMVLYPKA